MNFLAPLEARNLPDFPRLTAFYVRPISKVFRFLWEVIYAVSAEGAAELYAERRELTGDIQVRDHGIFHVVMVPKATLREDNQ